MPSVLPLILLPPSEGKASGGNEAPWAPGTMAIDLDAPRAKVMASLARAMRGNEAVRSKLLGVKGTALAAATLANRTVHTSLTMPAIERYTGVLYDALDHRSLSTPQRRRLDGSVLILSGLWGAVAPADPIPDYKLKMGVSLPGLGKLSTWWSGDLSARLVERAGARPVWNLLPNEHAAAWRPPEGLAQYTVRFLEHRPDGSLSAVSHWNKFLKGALLRFLLARPGASPADLAGWEHPSGFRYDPARTEEHDAVTVITLTQSA
jgi:cytoplasmic iron level regulating protein YaaA (DUF328/UPF0246 family)